MTIMGKVCRECGTEKALAEFYTRPTSVDGHHNSCKVVLTCQFANMGRSITPANRFREFLASLKSHFVQQALSSAA